ncbi:hypothetical protein GE09DRAFT_1067114 [Coniochaeta sp. 2T2.1]|nr:hypothetical protein GE09DRAFT_1067114 [Coniochaeta sp. 2T2.1]
MVTSWAEGETRHLRLLVEPRRGWTKKLLRYAKLSPEIACRALFTGPYGTSISTRNCAIVLLVASGVGIVAQIPYLKQLVHDYNACRTLTRRIHLIWHLETLVSDTTSRHSSVRRANVNDLVWRYWSRYVSSALDGGRSPRYLLFLTTEKEHNKEDGAAKAACKKATEVSGHYLDPTW